MPKKKKKQRQQRELLEQGMLNGWNYAELSEYDDEDNELNEEEIEVMADPIVTPIHAGETAVEPSPPMAEQLSLLDEPSFSIPSEQQRDQLVYSQPEPAEDKPLSPASPPPQETLSELTADQPGQDEAHETYHETLELEPVQPGDEAPVRPAAVQRLAAELASRVTAFLNKPRKSQQDLAEDEAKFGRDEDELVAYEPDEPKPREPGAAMQRLLAVRAALTQHRNRKPRPAATDGGLTRQLNAGVGELSDWAFQECYYIGVLLLRYGSDLRRQCFRGAMWFRYTVPPFLHTKRIQVSRLADKFVDSCLEPFRDITVKTRSMRYRLSNRQELAENGQKEGVLRVLFRYFYSLGRPLNRISSFLLPILGCAVLAATVLYFQQINYALEVEYNGIKLGYVATESEFYEAQSQMYQRLLNEDYAASQDSRPTFRLVITDPQNVMDVDALTNRILSVSKTDVVSADGIYIDGAFLGAVEDGSEFLLYIDSILANYRTGTDYERVQFVKKVTVQQGIYPQSSLKPVHEIKNAVESNQSVPQLHTVQAEETLESLAADNNTTVDAIISLNPTLMSRVASQNTPLPVLSAGEEILVNKVELSLGIQVTRRESYTESLSFGTDYVDVNNMPESYTSTISNGIKGEELVIADITYVDGEQIDETIISRETTREPVNARVKRGTLKPAQFIAQATGGANDSLMWPVAGGYISAGLYGYRGHTGMDIAAPYGTGIYASAAGTVTFAVNYSYGAYGKRVDISHGNGITTRYAHCSEVLVRAGQYVQQGQLIAKIGRTGNASGNHCHFEVRVNGVIMNPTSFVGSRFPG